MALGGTRIHWAVPQGLDITRFIVPAPLSCLFADLILILRKLASCYASKKLQEIFLQCFPIPAHFLEEAARLIPGTSLWTVAALKILGNEYDTSLESSEVRACHSKLDFQHLAVTSRAMRERDPTWAA